MTCTIVHDMFIVHVHDMYDTCSCTWHVYSVYTCRFTKL